MRRLLAHKGRLSGSTLMGRVSCPFCGASQRGIQIVFFFDFFVFFSFHESVWDTRSARRYCKTGATLGRGAAQALQDPNHGLNNSLKLM